MTYRERKERKAERLRDWSAGNARKSNAAHDAADQIASGIPMGQPILVGHHSEKRHRKDVARIENGMRTGIDLNRKAKRQAETADGIDRQLATSIYDDDPDAIERLEKKLVAMESRRDQMKAANSAFRKEHRAELKAMTAYERNQAAPYPSYATTNLTGNISRTRDRLARLKREKAQGPTDRLIFARFDSECANCGADLKRGDQIRYNKQQGARCYPECQEMN